MSGNEEKVPGSAQETDQTIPAPVPGRPGKAVPRSRMSFNIAATLVLGVLLVVMVNYISNRHYSRSDWTKGGFHELSDKTVKVLEGLDRDVDIVVFISSSSRLHGDIEEVLDRYGSHTSHLGVEIVDPDLDPARFRVLQKKYKVRSGMVDEFTEMSEQVVVVRSGDSSKFVNVDDMTEIEYGDDFMSSGDAEIKGFKAEEAITGAILEVTSGEKLTVCFVEGHGEWESTSWNEDGLGTAVEFLRRDNYEVQTVDLQQAKAVPPECAVTVIAGPERPLPKEHVELLSSYLASGGNLLLFLEPIIDGEEVLPTGLEGLLEKVGIGSTNAVAIETDNDRLLVGGGVGIFVTLDYGEHAIVKPIEKFLSLWTLARPLTVIESSGAAPTVLVKTSESSWGERHIGESDSEDGVKKDADDIEGPLTLGVASRLPEGLMGTKPERDVKDGSAEGGRVVAYGDVHLLASGVVEDPTWVNRELFVGAVAWLTERENLISIPPKEIEKYEASLTIRDILVILVWVLVTIPGLVVVLGVFVALRRRR